MKKIFYFASAAAVLFTGCAKDDVETSLSSGEGIASSISASMYTGETTRTSLSENREFLWSAGDAIGVFDSGANSAQNVVFSLPNEYDGQKEGKFVSRDHKLLCGDTHFAYYPYQPGLDGVTSPAELKFKVLKNQNYSEGSFTTQSVPAIDPEFTVEEVDGVGHADIFMYPVVDYLGVHIKAVAPINTLTLSMTDASYNKILLAGEDNVTASEESTPGYDEGYEYYLAAPTLETSGGKGWTSEITLTCGQLTDAVYPDEREYVFVIPADIVAKAKNEAVNVKIVVNAGTDTEKELTTVLSYDKEKKQIANNFFNVYENAEKKEAFLYNPNDAVIIDDQLELLTYLNEYDGNKKDAYLNPEGKFDFSRETMIELSTTLPDVNEYITGYLSNGFPSIEEFDNTFTGNGTEISGVNISDEKGIFNVIGNNGKVSGIVFKNVTAKGSLLAGETKQQAAVEDVTVDNCTAASIIGRVRVAQVGGVTVKDDKAEKSILHFADELRLGADLKIGNVTDFNVAGAAFKTVGLGSTHQVIEVAEPCAVEDVVGSMTVTDSKDGGAYSLVIAGTSYWTGYAAESSEAENGVTVVKYAEQLAYAVQNGDSSDKLRLANDMVLNGSVTDEKDEHVYVWECSTSGIAAIDGDGHTVKDVYMKSSGEAGVQDDMAPFTAGEIADLTVEGVNIAIETKDGVYVPAKIAGLSLDSSSVKNVTVTGIAIEGLKAGYNSIVYDAGTRPHVGLLLAEATDAKLENCTVEGSSNIKGYIGSLIGYATLSSSTEMQVRNCSAVIKLDTDEIGKMETADDVLTEFENVANTSYYGQPIGVLNNSTATARTIRFWNEAADYAPAMFVSEGSGDILAIVNGSEHLYKK